MNSPINLTHERILITGAAGFLGRHVVAELRTAGIRENHILAPRQSEYDLTDATQVVRMFDELKPTMVLHLAAQVGGIGANRDNPGRFFYANLAMGMNLIENARRMGLKKFVQIGTVCSYPKFAPVPFREADLWNGYPEETNAPYGVAKKALLVMLQGYRAQYGLNGIFLMPVNLYGPYDNFDLQAGHVIPALIRKFVEARRAGASNVTVWGTGNVSREFLYVEDCARAIVLATQRYDGADPVNVGAGFEITIADLVDKIRTLTGYQGKVVWDSSKPDGQPRRMLDTSRAEDRFGFKAQISFDDGLRRTIAWFESTAKK
ncbi:MAG: GDP-L-fucose synthase [Planctomycetes bacterium]|nr:GDP-L-fucose synthase [Planctomycetota bacterium]